MKTLGSKTSFSLLLVTIVMMPAVLMAQAPGVVGVDHVGINVPNLDQAINFFHDLFGFDAVTQIGPWTMDPQFKNSYHIHESSDKVTIKMLRAGDGSSIELFEFDPRIVSPGKIYRDDPFATHIALYTSDINATKGYLESKGIKFLTEVNHGVGNTAGESWVYLETPWGSTIELNSYPDGKGYEKNKPTVKLWSPSNVIELTTDTPSQEELRLIVSRQIQILNTEQPGARLALMSGIYHKNVVFFDHDGVYRNADGINGKIEELHEKFKGFLFSLVKFDNSYNTVRLYWSYGPKEDPKMITGMDMIVLENNMIRSFNVYLDHVPAK